MIEKNESPEFRTSHLLIDAIPMKATTKQPAKV